jgi:spore coat polysaccharide biosynthesis protein SpsF
MTVVAIVQARMSSTRLPGKVLKLIAGKPVLAHVLDRLKFCKSVDQVVVAITKNKEDNRLLKWCFENGVECFRGESEDVLSRFYHCAKAFEAEEIVRVTSDNPLVDPEIVDEVIQLRQQNQADYAANNLEKTFPHGFDAEVITFKALAESHFKAFKKPEREHVTQYVRHLPDQYKLVNLFSGGSWYDIRVTLDEDEDKQLIELILRLLGQDCRLSDLKKLFSEFPMLRCMNNEVRIKHKKYNEDQNIS